MTVWWCAASDGLWDVLSNERVCQLALAGARLDPQQIATDLVSRAYSDGQRNEEFALLFFFLYFIVLFLYFFSFFIFYLFIIIYYYYYFFDRLIHGMAGSGDNITCVVVAL